MQLNIHTSALFRKAQLTKPQTKSFLLDASITNLNSSFRASIFQ